MKVFLEYQEELGVRGKNVREKIQDFLGVVQVNCPSLHPAPLFLTYLFSLLHPSFIPLFMFSFFPRNQEESSSCPTPSTMATLTSRRRRCRLTSCPPHHIT